MIKKPYRIMGGESGYDIEADGVLTDAIYPKDNRMIRIDARKVAE